MTNKATVTRTRSGNLRGGIDPQALARGFEQVKDDVRGIKQALSPAPITQDMTGTRGPGAYPREPVTLRQVSSRTGDPWAGDIEHSAAFLEAIRRGDPLPQLRRMSADDAIMRAERDQPSAVMWVTARGEAVKDGSVVQAPEQRSVVHNEWSSFPDHQPAPPASKREPAWMVAREQAARMPARQPESIVRGL